MVADTGPDVLFPALTWASAAAAETDPGSCGSPRVRWVSGCRRLPAALCAKYVPKFEAWECPASVYPPCSPQPGRARTAALTRSTRMRVRSKLVTVHLAAETMTV
jgi:hypothetical protein